MKKMIIGRSEYILSVKKNDPGDVHVDVRVVMTIGSWKDDGVTKDLYGYSGSDSTHIYEEAPDVISGTIKWDGCGDLTIYGSDEGSVHVCGALQGLSIGVLLQEIYRMAKEELGSSADDDCWRDELLDRATLKALGIEITDVN